MKAFAKAVAADAEMLKADGYEVTDLVAQFGGE